MGDVKRSYDLEAAVEAHRAARARGASWFRLSDMEYDAIAGAVLLAVKHSEAAEALKECARLSGADLSGGFPTRPDLPTYAVQCVRELRKDYDQR